jgi:glutaredoxin
MELSINDLCNKCDELGLVHTSSQTKKDLIEKVPHARSVPQIFIGGEYIGGLPELKKRFAVNDNYKTTTMG